MAFDMVAVYEMSLCEQLKEGLARSGEAFFAHHVPERNRERESRPAAAWPGSVRRPRRLRL